MREKNESLRRIAYPTRISSRSVGQELGPRNQLARLLHCLGLAKEQFAHRETEELLAMLDQVAAKTGSRGEVFDSFLTMTVCALAGGTMEEEYLATVAKYAAGEKGKRPIDHLAAAFGKLIAIMDKTRAKDPSHVDLYQRGNESNRGLRRIAKVGKMAEATPNNNLRRRPMSELKDDNAPPRPRRTI